LNRGLKDQIVSLLFLSYPLFGSILELSDWGKKIDAIKGNQEMEKKITDLANTHPANTFKTPDGWNNAVATALGGKPEDITAIQKAINAKPDDHVGPGSMIALLNTIGKTKEAEEYRRGSTYNFDKYILPTAEQPASTTDASTNAPAATSGAAAPVTGEKTAPVESDEKFPDGTKAEIKSDGDNYLLILSDSKNPPAEICKISILKEVAQQMGITNPNVFSHGVDVKLDNQQLVIKVLGTKIAQLTVNLTNNTATSKREITGISGDIKVGEKIYMTSLDEGKLKLTEKSEGTSHTSYPFETYRI